MHWIEQYRRTTIGPEKPGRAIDEHFSRMVLAEQVRKQGVGCSAMLIELLELGGITHPAIANAIAQTCRATPQQRDMIVAKWHRGNWVRPRKVRRDEYTKTKMKPEPMTPGVLPPNAKAIVQLNIAGTEIKRFESMEAAAAENFCTPREIRRRCARTISAKTNEFKAYDYTWRFAEEWDKMTPAQKIADILAASRERTKELEADA